MFFQADDGIPDVLSVSVDGGSCDISSVFVLLHVSVVFSALPHRCQARPDVELLWLLALAQTPAPYHHHKPVL